MTEQETRNLTQLSREDLEQEATAVGIEQPDDRERFPNKETLIDAIAARQQPTEVAAAGTTPAQPVVPWVSNDRTGRRR